MLAVDCETTGKDFFSGCMPYFVSTCDDKGNVVYWEWDVNPLTRQPIIPTEDVDELREFLNPYDNSETDVLPYIFQNAKFDVKALSLIAPEFGEDWLWDRTEDTAIAGHLLDTKPPHNLSAMCLRYIGQDIRKYDKELEVACKSARNYARRHLKDWRIAKEGLPELPSLKGEAWKIDAWLPRAIAKHCKYPKDHPWYNVLKDYALTDACVTVLLWQELKKRLQDRKLMKIYRERMKGIPIAYKMENTGVTINGANLEELTETYQREAQQTSNICELLAESMGFDLTLPKGGKNKQLVEFTTSKDGLNLPSLLTPDCPRTGKHGFYGKSGEISLATPRLKWYLTQLESKDLRRTFIENLMERSKRNTALSYMQGYQRFWLAIPGQKNWYRIHPSLNPIGTETLRWSSSNPNEQNISKKEGFNLRYCFCPLPDREWWSIDAQNIELRIPGYESGQKELIELFERPNDPPYYGSEHLLNFSTIYPDIWEAELKEVGLEKVGPHCKEKYKSTWYQRCKNGGFAVGYGAVNKSDGTGTADKAFHRAGCHTLLLERFANKEELNQKYIAYANKHGYVETLPDKQVDPKRGYPIQCERTAYGKVKPTIPLNYHVQGTAMWWTMRAMIKVSAYLKDYNSRQRNEKNHIYLILQVHDELVLDLPYRADKGNQKIIDKIKTIMSSCGDDIGIPTPCSASWHPNNWSEEL